LPGQRLTLIPDIHAKLTHDGKGSEPDLYLILDQWLGRHPEVRT
jgi:hypothetical protein